MKTLGLMFISASYRYLFHAKGGATVFRFRADFAIVNIVKFVNLTNSSTLFSIALIA